MGALARVGRLVWPAQAQEPVGSRSIGLSELLGQFMTYQGVTYGLTPGGGLGFRREEIPDTYDGVAGGAFKANPVVFACMALRMRIFSEARFQFQSLSKSGTPGDLFGTQELRILEKPWTNGTTASLLARMIQDVDLAGNFYARRVGDTLYRMPPQWVSIILGSKQDPEHPQAQIDAEPIGYAYRPGGGQDVQVLLPEQVAHWAPITDPQARFRGMSWLTPVLREVMADQGATEHKLKFFENGATPQVVVKFDASVGKTAFEDWVTLLDEGHAGAANAYRTMYLGGGADAQVVGADLRQIDFKATQGAGETRIASAAGVPPVLVGLSEGLAAATYSNYGMARRAFGDLMLRPYWHSAADALASIINVPPGSRLYYDADGISFLQEDAQDAANIQQTKAISLKALVDTGFTPESAVQAILADDFSKLDHTNLFSVQLQPAGQISKSTGVYKEVPVPTDPNMPAAAAPKQIAAPRAADLRALLEEFSHSEE